MSVPQNDEKVKAFAPRDKTIEVIGMAAFFIICVLLAALNEFDQGDWLTGGFFVFLVLLVIGAQLFFLKGHETNHAEIEDNILALRQGNERMTYDLSQVQRLTILQVRRGSAGVNTQYWAIMQDGKAWRLFEGGTFKEEEDLLRQISNLAGVDWQ